MRFLDRIGSWKTIIASICGLFIGGFSTNAYLSRYLTHSEASEIITVHDATGHPALVGSVAVHESRLTRMEVDLEWLTRTLFKIADKLEVKDIPPPPVP